MPIQSGSLVNNPTGLSILTTLKWSKTSIVGELTIEEKHVCKQRYYFQVEILSNQPSFNIYLLSSFSSPVFLYSTFLIF